LENVQLRQAHLSYVGVLRLSPDSFNIKVLQQMTVDKETPETRKDCVMKK
jgi:hypothetical protein